MGRLGAATRLTARSRPGSSRCAYQRHAGSR